MKKVCAGFLVACLSVGSVLMVQASDVKLMEAEITDTDGKQELLTGDDIATRLRVSVVDEEADPIPGYDSVMTLDTVYPKDASEVYLSFYVPDVIPGSELAVYQNGEEIPGEVTGENEITLQLMDTGKVTVYKPSEKEDVAEETTESETESESEIQSEIQETETEILAPATGESDLLEISEILMILLGMISLYAAHKVLKK